VRRTVPAPITVCGIKPSQELAVFGFDLMHYDGEDIRSLHLIERRLQVLLRSDVHCLHLVQAFDKGAKLLEPLSGMG